MSPAIPTDLAEVIALHKQLFGGFTMTLETDPADGGQTDGDADPSPLGDGGIKALQAERDAHKQAKKQLGELQAQIDALNAEKLSDLEKAQAAAKAASDDAATARREALRYRIAGQHGISTKPGDNGEASDADLFLTADTEEAMLAQAARLAGRAVADERQRQNAALVDPTQGGGVTVAPKVDPGVPRLAAAFDTEMNSK